MFFTDKCSIVEKNVPWKYSLSYNFKRRILKLKMHKAVIEFLREFLDNNENYNAINKKIIRSTMRELWNPQDGFFGFESIFLLKKNNEYFIEFEIPIDGLEDCWGYDPFLNISKTFTALTEVLESCYIDTSCTENQILNFITSTHEGLHGGSLCGEFGIGITNWSKSEGIRNKTFTNVEDIAFEVSQLIWRHANYRTQFDIYTGTNGGFYATIPGDACGINPENSYDLKDDNVGHFFDCHNVDSARQQLLLLIVIAIICDIYKDLKTTP